MSLRWSAVLLAAASAFAAEYKASYDGRVVYFTGALADDLGPSRLWRWANGTIQSLLDAYTPNLTPSSIRLLRLSPDGRFALAHTSRFSPDQSVNRWHIFLDGSPRPLVEITDAQLVSMSPNGRWVVVYRYQAGRAVELFELSETGLRSAAVWPNPTPNGVPFIRIPNLPAMISDDVVVRVNCATSLTGCLWDSRSGTTEPELIPFDGTARMFYSWRARFLFIHQDYSGLVTPEAPAHPGEFIHLYITGIDPADFDTDLQNSFAAVAHPTNVKFDVQ